MECNKIKSLLSEYLDKTLRSDLGRIVNQHLLSCKTCSNEFFLMKSIAGELGDLERLKAPNYLLNRVNKAVKTRPWFAKVLDFVPGSGGFKLPMEFVTLATTVALVFLIFANIHVDKNENPLVAESGVEKTFSNNDYNSKAVSTGPVRLDFVPVSDSKTLSSENVFWDGSGRNSGSSAPSDMGDMIHEDSPALKRDNLISRFREITLLAEGDIVSREYHPGTDDIDAFTVKIPADNYASFIQNAEKIGRFHPPAPSLSDQSSVPVFLRIRLNLSD